MFVNARRFFRLSAAVCLICVSTAFIPVSSWAKVIVKEKISYYNITGKTGAQLHKSMRKNASKHINIKHTLAATVPDMSIKNIKADVVGRHCIVKNADVYLTITYILPRWKGKNKANKSVVKSWDKFNKLLIRHEKKHGKITVDGANSFHKELRRLKGSVSKKCKDFGNSAERRFEKVGARLAAKQKAFDRREGFGLSQVRRAEKKLFFAK